jgi:hypothetical protein
MFKLQFILKILPEPPEPEPPEPEPPEPEPPEPEQHRKFYPEP